MAEQKTFRTAFNGFNREDVVHYIEHLNAKHLAQVNELNAEIEFLRSRPSDVQDAPDPETVQSLKEQLEQALRERDAAIAARDAAAAQTVSANSNMEQELEAYRRAERTERIARERAEKVYHRVNGVLADATLKVDDASARIGELTDMVCAQLAELQGAVTTSKEALKDAAQTMYTIRPGAEEE